MLGREEEAAIEVDVYIDALLATHGRLPVALPGHDVALPVELQRAMELLESGLPRFHPSFLFVESLAQRLRGAPPSEAAIGGSLATAGEVVALPLPMQPHGVGSQAGPIDRRLLVGGAIASTVSLAGAAMLVRAAQQRRGRARPRPEWLS